MDYYDAMFASMHVTCITLLVWLGTTTKETPLYMAAAIIFMSLLIQLFGIEDNKKQPVKRQKKDLLEVV